MMISISGRHIVLHLLGGALLLNAASAKHWHSWYPDALLNGTSFDDVLPIGSRHYGYITYPPSAQDICTPNPCGRNTQCLPRDGRPVCVCLPGHYGNPLVYCQKGECAENAECGHSKICRSNQCVDPCVGSCGVNANCRVQNHVPVCSCPAGYTGNPFTSCRRFAPQEQCHPSPCGKNTDCNVINGVPTCSCKRGYMGDPLTECRHECENDYECESSQKCNSDYRCVPVCSFGACASNARCEAHNHRAVCTCMEGTFGDPYTSCRYECESHYDCPAGKPSCSGGKCVDPCARSGVCGQNADCRVKDRTTPVCSCPRHMTGDPFVSCRPFTKADLCDPNPCGVNADCTPGHDRSGMERSVCTCPRGYFGNALVRCTKGECQTHDECGYDKACLGYTCSPVCRADTCGVNAECNPRDHVAICSCPRGYTGNPMSSCRPAPVSGSLDRFGRIIYHKK